MRQLNHLVEWARKNWNLRIWVRSPQNINNDFTVTVETAGWPRVIRIPDKVVFGSDLHQLAKYLVDRGMRK